MVKNSSDKFAINNVQTTYQKLQMLKKAVSMGEDEYVNEKILLDNARKNNENEIYLIAYLVDVVMNAPKELQQHNDLLINCYNNPKEYLKIYKQTQKMFTTNPKFRWYSAKIFADLDLLAPFNCKIINLTIFGLCHEFISDIVKLNPQNIVMNLHILQKWLSKQNKVTLSHMNITEQKIILYLACGYTPENILDEEVGILDDISPLILKNIIYDTLPSRCNVQSICQVMAIMFFSNPDLIDVEKVLQILDMQ